MTPEEYYNNLYLAHHGIKGQKHGLRRWQNRDGSLTPAGREHYGVGDPREGGSYDDYSNEYNDYDRAQAEEREYQRNRQEKIDKMVRIGVGVAAVAVTAYALKKLSSKNVKDVSEKTISEGAEKAKEVVNKMKGKSISDFAKMDVSKLESKPGNFNFSRDKTEAKAAASFLEKLNSGKNNKSSGISSIAKMDVSKLKSQPASNSMMSKNLSSIASKASSGKSTVDNVSSMLDSLNKDLLKHK